MALAGADTPSINLPIRPSQPTSSSDALDPALKFLTASSFDPVTYLNDTLPPLSISTSATTTRSSTAIPLAELSSQTQSLLSQLNAQSARLSNTLTQLTNDILRSSGRLAYEVEILRGETVGLSESLTDVLKDDIARFVPEGKMVVEKKTNGHTADGEEEDKEEGGGQTDQEPNGTTTDITTQSQPQSQPESDLTPPYIHQLRMLTSIRTRLDTVITTFGHAMEWPLAPSELSAASSFISVSAPEPDSSHASREEKGKEVARRLRTEVADLLDNAEDPYAGLESAEERVAELRELARVWKGTAEEKARARFVEGLGRLVEEKRRVVDAAANRQQRQTSSSSTLGRQGSVKRDGAARRDESPAAKESGTGGLFRGLQRLRDEIYLE